MLVRGKFSGLISIAFIVLLAICGGNGAVGDFCTNDSKCGYYGECISQTCRCRASDTVYDPQHGICEIKAGYRCHENYGCVGNAFCSIDSLCSCKIGFFQSTDGRCVHRFGEPCMSSTDCNVGFVCDPVKHTCVCPYSDEYYNETTKTCFGNFGGSCSNQCYSNYICEDASCTCPKGLILSRDGKKCTKGLGEKCSKNMECDSSRVLLCLHERCSCQHPFQEYSSTLEMCVGLEGAHCNLTSTDSMKNYNESYFCVEGTTCQPIIGSSQIGMCKSLDVTLSRSLAAFFIFIAVGTIPGSAWLYWLYKKHGPRTAPDEADDDDSATATTFLSYNNEHATPKLGSSDRQEITN